MALTTEQLKQLEALKDINLPAPVSWWPLAPGWWVLITLIFFIVVSLFFLLWRLRYRLRRRALVEFNKLLTESDNLVLCTKLSVLLKRLAIQTQGKEAAQLSGDAWSNYLQARGIPAEYADFLAHIPYSNQVEGKIDRKALVQHTRQWIRRQT